MLYLRLSIKETHTVNMLPTRVNIRKTASLGEMIQELTPLGVDVPGGFGVSSTAYDAVLDRFDTREHLTALLKDVDGEEQSKLLFFCIESSFRMFCGNLYLQRHLLFFIFSPLSDKP